jgi:hypothetical protein
MSLTSKIVNESPAARRFRLLAPLVALLALVALMMAPGIIAEFRDGSITVGPVSQDVAPPAGGGAQRSAAVRL